MSNIYFFSGPDSYRSLSRLSEWTGVFSQKYGAGTVREIQTDANFSLATLLSESSLFDATTLTVLRDPFNFQEPEAKNSLTESFLELAEAGLPKSKHLLIWQREALDNRTKFTRRLRELSQADKIKLYEFDYLNQKEGLSFIAGEFKKRQLSVKRDAALLLYEFCSSIPEQLDSAKAINAIEQLSAFCHEKKLVEKNDVEKLIVPSREEDVFLPLLRAFCKKDVKAFLTATDLLVGNASADQELLGVVSALYEQVKNMVAVLNLSQEHNTSQIDELLEFKKGRAQYVLSDAKRFGKDNLNKMLAKLLEIEYNVKQGRTVLAGEISILLQK